MKATAVVGHPASGYADVWAMLQTRGIAGAMPSRRESMLPEQINDALCKAYKCPELYRVTVESGFSQIDPAPVWQNMALDLMLGNLHQPLWGWADPRTIFALDYWAATVPQITFVLVYDEPHRVLQGSNGLVFAGDSFLPEERELAEKLDNWAAFNSALIQFHLRHPGRTLLAHRRQAVQAADQDMQKLQELLDAPLLPAGDADILASPHKVDNALHTNVLAALSKRGDPLEALPVSPNEVADAMHASQVEQYLVEAMIAENPSAMELYAELESVADLPAGASQRQMKKGAAAEAWCALSRQRGLNYQVIRRLFDQVERVKEATIGPLTEVSEKTIVNPRLKGTARVSHAAVSEDESRGMQHKSTIESADTDRVREENELLLSQLHNVQEELERYYLRAIELEKRKQSMEMALLESRREVKAFRLKFEATLIEKKERINHLKSVRFGKERRIAQLKARLDETWGELEALTNGPVDLSTTPGRVMLKVAATRLLYRFFPTSIFKRRGSGVERISSSDLGKGGRSK